MSIRMKMVSLLGAVGLSLGALAVPAQAADTATVSVLHAIPGATVDVYANGDELLTEFEPGTLTDPQELPAGSYDLKVVATGDGADGEAITEANGVEVPAGANVTVTANLSADGEPTLTPFVNDVSKVAAGQARLTVRHTAAAPAVDVRAAEQPVFEGLTNPNEDKADLPAGTVSADVTLAGESDPVIGPADLNLAEGSNTIVYAWGSAEDDNLQLAVQTITGLHSAPTGVPGGTGGQAAQIGSSDAPIWVYGMLAAGLLGLAVAGTRLTQGSSRR